MAAMVFTNLLYLVGAVAGATLVSALIVFRHRKPKSLEAGIDNFTRELQALAPDSRNGQPGAERPRPSRPSGGPGRPVRSGPGRPAHPERGPGAAGVPGRSTRQGSSDPINVRRYSSDQGGATSPETEDQSG